MRRTFRRLPEFVGIFNSNKYAFCLPMDTGAFAGSDRSFEKAKNFAMSGNLGRMTEIPDTL
jgi:hypothetical protein